MPNKPIIIRSKSSAIKREEKKGGAPNDQKYYKVKIKGSDPKLRAGGFDKAKIKEITKKKADKLYEKGKNIRKDAENTGKSFATLQKQEGYTGSTRIKSSKVVQGKSNLNLKGRAVQIVAGKKKVGELEGKKPRNQYERPTSGKQTYVAVKNPFEKKKQTGFTREQTIENNSTVENKTTEPQFKPKPVEGQAFPPAKKTLTPIPIKKPGTKPTMKISGGKKSNTNTGKPPVQKPVKPVTKTTPPSVAPVKTTPVVPKVEEKTTTQTTVAPSVKQKKYYLNEEGGKTREVSEKDAKTKYRHIKFE